MNCTIGGKDLRQTDSKMQIRCVNEKYPVWELTELALPKLDVDALRDYESTSALPISKKRKSMLLDWNNANHFYFKECLIQRKAMIQDYIKSGHAYEECEELLRMWPDKFHRFDWGTGELSTQIIYDSKEFYMDSHIDNRMVVGVMIVNLQDNPENSGTNFHGDPHTKKHWYSGLTRRNTGVFFLNNWNTWHSVQNNGHQRLICYDIMHLGEMFKLSTT